MHDNNALQDCVKQYLAKNKVRKKDLADIVGITTAKLSHWFAGRVILNAREISAVKKFLTDY